ncbi:MAG TPA: hypothetical protein DGO89_00775 [Microcoleaceae bacterium UBA9251]|nr:hypothetical protein [Microcoleaceae cyanobacterium UBA9251]
MALIPHASGGVLSIIYEGKTYIFLTKNSNYLIGFAIADTARKQKLNKYSLPRTLGGGYGALMST